MTDTSRLRALAEAATPGEWGVLPADTTEIVSRSGYDIATTWDAMKNDRADVYNTDYKRTDQNAAYIAAANPQTVLALLDRIAELEEAVVMVREQAERVDRLEKAFDFVAMWAHRGPPHGGPGNEAVCLDAIRNHSAIRARATLEDKT